MSIIIKTKILSVVLFSLFTILCRQSFSQTPCIGNCSGTPQVYLENDCSALDAIIARSIYMSHLNEYNTPGIIQDMNHPCNLNLCSSLSNPDIDHQCSFSNGVIPFCPNLYCQDINSCVQLKSPLIANATAFWGHEDALFTSAQYGWNIYNSNSWAKQCSLLVKDFNSAYACAMLRRPFIGVAIQEFIGVGVNNDFIPPWVISEFNSEMSVSENSYYHPVSPRPLQFRFNNIADPSTLEYDDNGQVIGAAFDLSKIEARMWTYHYARTFIDAGYTEIHFALLEAISHHDPNHLYLQSLLQKIRDYAASKNQALIIETGTEEGDLIGNTMQTDFYVHPIRPDETSSGVCANKNVQLVTYNSGVSSPSDINKFTGANGYNGCNYTLGAPYALQFDNFPANSSEIEGTATPLNNWDTWGWDETSWFNKYGSDNCKSERLDGFICQLKQLENSHRGYFELPGILPLREDADVNWAYFHLSNHPDIVTYLLNHSYNPLFTNNVSVTYVGCGNFDDDCTPNRFHGYKEYRLIANSINCQTVLVWTIISPSGQVVKKEFGTVVFFNAEESGTYNVQLLERNWGYSTSWNGKRTYSFSINVPYNECCGPYHDELRIGSNVASDSSFMHSNLSENYINLIPNPAFETVIMSCTVIPAEVIISDIEGLKAIEFKPSTSSFNIDISQLPKGVYFVNTLNSEGIVDGRKKLVKL